MQNEQLIPVPFILSHALVFSLRGCQRGGDGTLLTDTTQSREAQYYRRDWEVEASTRYIASVGAIGSMPQLCTMLQGQKWRGQSCRLTCQRTLSYSAKVQTSYTGRTRPNKTRRDTLRISCDRRSQARVWGFHTHTEHEGRQRQKDLRPHRIRMSSCFLWPTYTVLKELRVCCRRICGSWLTSRCSVLDPSGSLLCGSPTAE